MNLAPYTGYFHDGIIIGIQSTKEKIEIIMESSELDSEWDKNNILLSKINTIKGKLHLEKIKKISINHEPVKQLYMIYDEGEILRFRINKNNVMLLAKWMNYLPKKYIEKTEVIEIEADSIYWENIP